MEAFADRLLRLKEEAGDPSYAEMSSRLGAAASKSSLASAAQGRKLPTWETTWEFVRVLAVDRLGHDPAETEREWREFWEHTKAVSTDGAVPDETLPNAATAQVPAQALPATAVAVVPVPSPSPAPSAEAAPVPSPSPARRGRGLVAAIVSAAVVAGGLIFFMATKTDRQLPPAVTTPSPIAKDDSEFVDDITYPDGSKVRQGSFFKKVWRIRNTGTTHWRGRRLVRINAAPCRSPESVVIPPTAPGQTVDIAVRVQSPDKPGKCRIYWKMTDAAGRELFPLKRPVFLDVQVTAS
ncbi:NBR1-Ig-like domain-containing protein [Sphaerisporangium fuscum]|uniref:NBR1-Ig-like domain-containing protein n=1 Tax=Sphaerisporangium fuscum TaxID=2835868 RepID=UPI001BDCBB76|nr:NBR1-Ig-like domain-containing protein [Sphaerisporangium fuscum]